MKPTKPIADFTKPLKDYTNKELRLFLEDNDNQPSDTLAWICSEILRRIVNTYQWDEDNETN